MQAAVVALGVLLAPLPAGAYQKEVKALAGELGKTVQAAGKRTIAVVDFTDLEGNVTALGRFLAEELSVSLAESASKSPGGFDVIDRNHLASLLREHKLTASGLLNRITARKLGQISGVEALVTGSLTDFGGDEVRISVKVLDMSTAKVIGAKQANIAQSSTIRGLLAQGITANEVTEAAESASPSGPAVPATTTRQAASPPSAREGPQLAETNDFVFELQGCQRSGQTVECHLRIANRGSDQSLELFQASRIFDDQGNQYGPFRAQIANATGNLPYSNSSLDQILIHNVPVHASLSFSGFSPAASRITSFYLVGRDGDDDRFRVDFRNIPITSRPIAGLGGSGGGQDGTGGAGAGGIKQMIRDEAIDATRKSLKKWKDKLMGPDEPAEDGGSQIH